MNIANIDSLVDNIIDSYNLYGGINETGQDTFPNKENVVEVMHELQNLIFPGYKTAEEIDSTNMRYIIGQRVNKIVSVLTKEIQKALIYEVRMHKCPTCRNRKESEADAKSREESENTEFAKKSLPRNSVIIENIEKSHCFGLAEKTSLALIEAIPELRRIINLDAEATFSGDPAAKSIDEVIVSYPGLEAIVVYRIAHFLHKCGVPVIPRIMTERIHGKTGIDIHPAAEIGESFCIDHGTGVVIGETTVIGKNVKIYQGVTLGALSVNKDMQDKKRHPTIEDNVTIYANATILGGKTVIGRNSTIGGNTWITRSVPENTTLKDSH